MIDLPVGVIEPYRRETGQIPISGSESHEFRIVDVLVKRAMREYGIVGCGVSIIRRGHIVYSRGFGYSRLPHTPFLTTTATRCGSLAKPITALCALILFDQGRLDLDAKILPILNEIGIRPTPVGETTPDPRIAEITVRQLMNHTSGIPPFAAYTAWRPEWNVAAAHDLNSIATAADVTGDALGNVTLESVPGTNYRYANANFVILARIIEARSKMRFADFLTNGAMPCFGPEPDEIYVSRNQESPDSPSRGPNEAAYYQTSGERYVSFVPSDRSRGQVFGEAYRGYATEASDGAGGLACTARGIAKILANLGSASPALSASAIEMIRTPPDYYLKQPGFDIENCSYYSMGFQVRRAGDEVWLSHGGMTNHCGGIISHSAGCKFVGVSNWNNSQSPYVDLILQRCVAEAVTAYAGSSDFSSST